MVLVLIYTWVHLFQVRCKYDTSRRNYNVTETQDVWVCKLKTASKLSCNATASNSAGSSPSSTKYLEYTDLTGNCIFCCMLLLSSSSNEFVIFSCITTAMGKVQPFCHSGPEANMLWPYCSLLSEIFCNHLVCDIRFAKRFLMQTCQILWNCLLSVWQLFFLAHAVTFCHCQWTPYFSLCAASKILIRTGAFRAQSAHSMTKISYLTIK